MKHNIAYFISLLALFFAACSPTRYLTDGEYILSRVKFDVDDSGTPSSERLSDSDLKNYIRQEPADRFLWTRLPESVYSIAKPQSTGWLSNVWRRIGSAPVVLDTIQTAMSATYMQDYAHSKGYFDAVSNYKIEYNDQSRRAYVTYSFYQGEGYKTDTIIYDFEDSVLADNIPGSEADLQVRLDERLDIVELNDERVRITEFLQNNGYWNFTTDQITFKADTTLGDRRAALTMVIDKDEQTDQNNALYKIGNIYVMPDYDPVSAITDPNYMEAMDTLRFRGLNIISNEGSSIRNRILRRNINIRSGELYNRSETQRLYDNLTRLGYYSSANISFSQMPDSVIEYYISPTDSTHRTRVHYLSAIIQTTPITRHNLTTSLETTINSIYFGIRPSIGYQNRNLMRGAEVLSVNLTGGWEYFFGSIEPSAYEVGVSTSLSIPRFVSPFNIDPRRMISNPRSRFELSLNYQQRPDYHRSLLNANWGYTWSYNRMSYVFRPIDVSFINVTNLNQDFIDNIVNPYLRNSYKPQILVGLSAGALYQSPAGDVTIGLNFQSAGNLIYGVKALTGALQDKNLFGMPYAQYIRGELSYTQRIALGAEQNNFQLVYRLYTGAGYAYGNSRNSSLPMDRLFYSGGTNSMRGWAIRTLGPGSELPISSGGFANQTGDMRLEANIELRYPIWGAMRGALFFDAGNVWLSGSENGSFHLNNFYKQLGFNTGIGIRFDLKYIVLRIDYGIRLYDPSSTTNPWRFNLRGNNTAFQFGIGYPF